MDCLDNKKALLLRRVFILDEAVIYRQDYLN